MKAPTSSRVTNPSKSKSSPSQGAGIVQIAIWKENPEISKALDVFKVYSTDVFYDFAKPLRLLDSPGWSPMIRVASDEGFFVFSTNEKAF